MSPLKPGLTSMRNSLVTVHGESNTVWRWMIHCDSLESLLWSCLRRGEGGRGEQEVGQKQPVLPVDYKWPWPVLKKGWDTHNSCATSSSASCINESTWNWAESRAETIVRLQTGVTLRHLGLKPISSRSMLVHVQWLYLLLEMQQTYRFIL